MSDSSDDLDLGDHPLSALLSQVNAFSLHNAAESGNVELLKGLLCSEPPSASSEAKAGGVAQVAFSRDLAVRSMRLRDDDGCSPLHLAIINGHTACVEVLLSSGASADTPCDGNPPLCMAACVAQLPGRSQDATTMIELLLKAGAEVQDRDDGGRTSLHWAACHDLASVVPLLLSESAESRERRLAAYNADVDMIRAAVAAELAATAEEAASALAGGLPAPPLVAGIQVPEQPDMPFLPMEQDNDGNTAAHLAARFGHTNLLNLLLADGGGWDVQALIKIRNKDGFNALHLAAMYNHSSAAQLLVEVGGGLTRQDKRGRTAAELALKRDHQETDTPRPPSTKPTHPTFLLAPDKCAQHRTVAEPVETDTSRAPTTKPTHPTFLLAPDECAQHRTVAEPIVRGGKEPPPENVHRLKVLVDPATGILRATEFGACGWESKNVPAVAMADLMRIHDWSYVRTVAQACAKIPDAPSAIGHLDPDTAICHHSYTAALKAAGIKRVAILNFDVHHGNGTEAVVANTQASFNHIQPPTTIYNHIHPPTTTYNHLYPPGIKRVAILDFDVHHGNGTEAVVANTQASFKRVAFSTPFSEGTQVFPTYKPWHDVSDADNIFVQGYGRMGGGWFYPGSGATADSAATAAPKAADSAAAPPSAQ
eukprot:gene28688-31856_t